MEVEGSEQATRTGHFMNGLDDARRLIAEERERKTGFLDIGNLGLTELPDELFELTHLRSLVVGTLYVWPETR